jgi:hypothetical protein
MRLRLSFARHSLADFLRKLSGKAKPYRTSSGKPRRGVSSSTELEK